MALSARHPVRTGIRVLLIAVVAILLGLPAAPAVADTADDPATISWSVRPADANGPDGRSWVEQEVDPGASVTEHAAVRNLGDTVVTFSLAAADGYFTENNRFNMLPADQESVAAGTWIDVADTVTVGPGETTIVPFTVTVPTDTQPGDYAAGIAASVGSVNAGDDTQVSVQSRVGFRVMTRVTGELAPSVTTAKISGNYATSWNPFTPGRLSVTFDVVNDGNARLQVSGTVSAGGGTASFPEDEKSTVELLPGTRQTITVRVDDVWPLVLLPADVVVNALVVSPTGDPMTELDAVTAQVVIWAMPWPQLIVLLGIALLIGALVAGRVRSRRRTAQLVAAAREEGERAARREQLTRSPFDGTAE